MRMRKPGIDTSDTDDSYGNNAGSFNFDNADLVYKNCNCASFREVSTGHLINSA